jgi:hypothetical protein
MGVTLYYTLDQWLFDIGILVLWFKNLCCVF